MKLENVLYSDLKQHFNDMLEFEEYPKTLLFAGGSAYVCNFEHTVFHVLIPKIETLLKRDRTAYENSEMNRVKKRLLEIYWASKDKNNWNIDLDSWREDNYFHSHKL